MFKITVSVGMHGPILLNLQKELDAYLGSSYDISWTHHLNSSETLRRTVSLYLFSFLIVFSFVILS